VHIVHAGDVVSNPPGTWHWHGASPGTAATHVTFEAPGDFDLDVERRDWDDTYGPSLARRSVSPADAHSCFDVGHLSDVIPGTGPPIPASGTHPSTSCTQPGRRSRQPERPP
jgi:hypothetical protein